MEPAQSSSDPVVRVDEALGVPLLLLDPQRRPMPTWFQGTQTMIGKPAAASVDVLFPHLDGHQVCRVSVPPSVLSVFVNEPGGHQTADFYAQVGNCTRQLTSAEPLDYMKTGRALVN